MTVTAIRRCCWAMILGAAVSACRGASASGVLFDSGVLTGSLEPGTLSADACGAAFDGTHYWTAEAGYTTGITLNRYAADGSLIDGFQTGIDHRSIFTDASGNLFATDFGGFVGFPDGIQVYQYQAAVPTLLYTLDTNPNSQMELGWRRSDGNLYGHSRGTIYKYDFTTGSQIGSFLLSGYSANRPADSQLAVVDTPRGEYLLTYDHLGNVGAWDFDGTQVGSCYIGLNTFFQIFSFSFANGMLWIETARNAAWNGYDIGLGQATAIEPTTWGAIKASYRDCTR